LTPDHAERYDVRPVDLAGPVRAVWAPAASPAIESDNGQSGAPGVHSGTNALGAAGPMQFGVGGAAAR